MKYLYSPFNMLRSRPFFMNSKHSTVLNTAFEPEKVL